MTITELRDPGFGAAVASEWSKFSSLRSVRVALVLGVLLGIATTALLCWVVLATVGDWSAEDREAFRWAELAPAGMLVTGTVFVVLGVTAVSSEYSSRMAALTFTATPRRERVLLAKVVVVATATFVATVVAVTGMMLVAQVMVAHLDQTGMAAGRVVWLVVGSAANSALLSVIAVGLTFVLRSAAGSVAALLGLIFVPPSVAPLLPDWWRDHGERYLPNAALDSLTLPRAITGSDGLGHWGAALVVGGWLAAALVIAGVTLDRRDV